MYRVHDKFRLELRTEAPVDHGIQNVILNPDGIIPNPSPSTDIHVFGTGPLGWFPKGPLVEDEEDVEWGISLPKYNDPYPGVIVKKPDHLTSVADVTRKQLEIQSNTAPCVAGQKVSGRYFVRAYW